MGKERTNSGVGKKGTNSGVGEGKVRFRHRKKKGKFSRAPRPICFPKITDDDEV